jgi:uncharacterized membrane-anchored protein YjiN (DUF445 family)
MELKDIQAFFEANKDNEEVKNYLMGLKQPTPEGVQQFLESEIGKKLIQPKLDSYFSKGLETWKQNNLEKLIDAEIKKRFPQKDEKDIELEKIKAQLAKMEAEKLRETLINKAIKIANEKKLPLDLIDFLVADNEENTIKNIEKLEQVFSKYIEEIVEERLKGSGYVPPSSGDSGLTFEKIKSMSQDEINKNWDKIQAFLKNNNK